MQPTGPCSRRGHAADGGIRRTEACDRDGDSLTVSSPLASVYGDLCVDVPARLAFVISVCNMGGGRPDVSHNRRCTATVPSTRTPHTDGAYTDGDGPQTGSSPQRGHHCHRAITDAHSGTDGTVHSTPLSTDATVTATRTAVTRGCCVATTRPSWRPHQTPPSVVRGCQWTPSSIDVPIH